MHAEALTRSRSAARAAGALLVTLALGAVLGGCRSHGDTASFGPAEPTSATPSASATGRCDVRKPVMPAHNVLTVAEVETSAAGGSNGGRAVQDTDYSRCDPTSPLVWHCQFTFPWQSGATVGQTMATLGVRTSRWAHIKTQHRTVDEIILDAGPGPRSGLKLLQTFAEACPGPGAAPAPGWVRLGAHADVMASGPLVVAVDLEEGSWNAAEETTVLRAAEAALARS